MSVSVLQLGLLLSPFLPKPHMLQGCIYFQLSKETATG